MQTTRFDLIVVGSGASGGWAAKRLSEAGIKVALLEGRKPQGNADFTDHVPAYDLTYRDKASEWMRRTRPRQRDCYACREWNYKWFVNDLEEPSTTPDDKPFSWQGRTRVVGGRTNVWGRHCPSSSGPPRWAYAWRTTGRRRLDGHARGPDTPAIS